MALCPAVHTGGVPCGYAGWLDGGRVACQGPCPGAHLDQQRAVIVRATTFIVRYLRHAEARQTRLVPCAGCVCPLRRHLSPPTPQLASPPGLLAAVPWPVWHGLHTDPTQVLLKVNRTGPDAVHSQRLMALHANSSQTQHGHTHAREPKQRPARALLRQQVGRHTRVHCPPQHAYLCREAEYLEPAIAPAVPGGLARGVLLLRAGALPAARPRGVLASAVLEGAGVWRAAASGAGRGRGIRRVQEPLRQRQRLGVAARLRVRGGLGDGGGAEALHAALWLPQLAHLRAPPPEDFPLDLLGGTACRTKQYACGACGRGHAHVHQLLFTQQIS